MWQAPQPVAVSVLAYGRDCSSFREIQTVLEQQRSAGVPVVERDLRVSLPDPAPENVGHKQNDTFVATIVAVYQQENFPEVTA